MCVRKGQSVSRPSLSDRDTHDQKSLSRERGRRKISLVLQFKSENKGRKSFLLCINNEIRHENDVLSRVGGKKEIEISLILLNVFSA